MPPLRRADLRRLLRCDPQAAAEILNTMTGDPPHGCVLLERLRFGPPSSWRAWQPGRGLMVLKLWPGGAVCDRTDPALRRSSPHPALVALEDWGDGWEVRPWVDGAVLGGGSLTRQQYETLIDAIAALHNAGQAHGDLTPANIILSTDSGIHLIDSGELCAGTPGWSPPCPHTPQQRDRFALDQLRRRVVTDL